MELSIFLLCLYIFLILLDYPGGPDGKATVYNAGDRVQALGWEDPLDKEMAIHSSTVAWKIPWTKEPGTLQSMGRKELDTTEQLHFTSLQSQVKFFLIKLSSQLTNLLAYVTKSHQEISLYIFETRLKYSVS